MTRQELIKQFSDKLYERTHLKITKKYIKVIECNKLNFIKFDYFNLTISWDECTIRVVDNIIGKDYII